MFRAIVTTAAAFGLAACSASGSPAPVSAPASAAQGTSSAAAASASSDLAAESLRTAVSAYSDAYLSGAGRAAWDLLSKRCQVRLSVEEMQSETATAKQLYGPVKITSFSVDELSGNLARVTYTYPVPALNQTSEPWVRESGQWREDDC